MQFDLTTDWSFDAPIARVWTLLNDVHGWPYWWPMVEAVVQVEEGDAAGVGAVNRFVWRTALPYKIDFEMRVLRVEAMALIEGRALGDLQGNGLWTLREDGGVTHVRYRWRVDVTRAWMRVLAPLLRRVFAWNHNHVMEQGRAGLERALLPG